jgi:electron transfer flavoprotein beta subunit
MAAKKKEIRQVAAASSAPRQRIVSIYVPEKGKKTQMLEGSPAEAAKALVKVLRDQSTIP